VIDQMCRGSFGENGTTNQTFACRSHSRGFRNVRTYQGDGDSNSSEPNLIVVSITSIWIRAVAL